MDTYIYIYIYVYLYDYVIVCYDIMCMMYINE